MQIVSVKHFTIKQSADSQNLTAYLLKLSDKDQNLEPEDRPISSWVKVSLSKLADQTCHILESPPLSTSSPQALSSQTLLSLVLSNKAQLEPKPILGRARNDRDGLTGVNSAKETIQRVFEGVTTVGGGLRLVRRVRCRIGGRRVTDSEIVLGQESISVSSGKSRYCMYKIYTR